MQRHVLCAYKLCAQADRLILGIGEFKLLPSVMI